VGRKRRELLADLLALACRAALGLASVQDDGFEPMPAVVTAILEDGHNLRIIRRTVRGRKTGTGKTG